MKVVAVSQRVDVVGEHQERRDALDQNVIRFLFACGFIAVPVPNLPHVGPYDDFVKDYCENFINHIKPHAIFLSGGANPGRIPERDKTEFAMINYAEQKKLPLLAICRGMQMLAYRAGTDITPVVGHVGTRHRIKGEIRGVVNSYHNYCVSDCPENYRVIATSVENSIEALKHRDLPWEGWMWHPERELSFADRDIERCRLLFN